MGNWKGNSDDQNETDSGEFSLKSPVALPRDVEVQMVPDGAVAVSPATARWIVLTDPAATEAAAMLLEGRTPQDTIDSLARRYGVDHAESGVHQVLAEVVDKDFFVDAPVDRDPSGDTYATLTLNVTNGCNLRCITCYKYSGQAAEEELPPDTWRRLIDEHAELGGRVVRISGGEPLFRGLDFIADLVERAKRRSLQVLLLSNGTMIDARAAARLQSAGLDRLQISLDGPDAPSNDAVRGKGVFARVMSAIEVLSTTKIELFLAMLPVPGLSLSAMFHRGAEFAADIRERFGDRIVISISQGLLPGRSVERRDDADFVATCRQIQADTMGRNALAGLDLWQWRPGRRNSSCGYARTLAVDPQGSVYACAAGEVVGSVRSEPLAAIRAKLSRLAMQYTVDALSECRDCSLRYLCGGPCRMQPKPCSSEHRDDLLSRLVRSNALRYDIESE